jgi:hypothetical protein
MEFFWEGGVYLGNEYAYVMLLVLDGLSKGPIQLVDEVLGQS